MYRIVLCLPLIVLLSCSEHDIGQPCPELLSGESPIIDGQSLSNTVVYNELVEQRVSFPCESLVCIATIGDTGYCSKRCRNDAGCPTGFTCRSIQTIGPFADSKFCAFSKCSLDSDCGDVEQFKCEIVPDVHPTQEVKLCRFINN